MSEGQSSKPRPSMDRRAPALDSHEDPDAFASAFRTAVAAAFPFTTVERGDRTLTATELRVDFGRASIHRRVLQRARSARRSGWDRPRPTDLWFTTISAAGIVTHRARLSDVQVLVGGKADHDWRAARRARRRLRTPFGSKRSSFSLLTASACCRRRRRYASTSPRWRR
jgi:hypothetical protein